jgi:uncharacterized membrane protein
MTEIPTKKNNHNSWSFHPKVRSEGELTFGERAADIVRNVMGSWPFVISALGFLAIWMVYNNSEGFDPFPFILLNLILSCLASLQGAILLIAAKRADQISSELAEDTYYTGQETLELLRHVRALTDDVNHLMAEMHEVLGDLDL